MASINGNYIFVEGETLNRSVEVTTHSVEKGLDISDNVKSNPRTLSINGKIVGENASTIQNKLKGYMEQGVLINYSGRTTLSNALITKFETSHPNTVWGGCEFSIDLQEIKVAQNSYRVVKTATTQKGGTQQTQTNNKSTAVYHTVKKGDTVWALVASSKGAYKKYGKSCQWVMDNNPNAFSRKGDFRTLQIGAKLLVGYK